MRQVSRSLTTFLKVQLKSHQSFANVRTALSAFLLQPVLNVLFALLIYSLFKAPLSAYETIVCAGIGATLISAIDGSASAFVRDRNFGIITEIVTQRDDYVLYLLSLSLVPACASFLGGWMVFILTSLFYPFAAHDFIVTPEVIMLGTFLYLLSALIGSLLGICAAAVCFSSKNPYKISNLFSTFCPLLTGSIIALNSYPRTFASICSLFPGSGIVSFTRLVLNNHHAHVLLIGKDFALCAVFLLIAYLLLKKEITKIRSGAAVLPL